MSTDLSHIPPPSGQPVDVDHTAAAWDEANEVVRAAGLGMPIFASKPHPPGDLVVTDSGSYVAVTAHDPGSGGVFWTRDVFAGETPDVATASRWTVAIVPGRPLFALNDAVMFRRFAATIGSKVMPDVLIDMLLRLHGGRPGQQLCTTGFELDDYLDKATRIRTGPLEIFRPRKSENGSWAARFSSIAFSIDERSGYWVVYIDDWETRLVPGGSFTFARTPRGRPIGFAQSS